MTQTDRVLSMLREAGQDGVCSLAFYEAHLPHARNRIAVELRDRGFGIASEPCDRGDHGDGAYRRYRIEHDPESQPKQLDLLRA